MLSIPGRVSRLCDGIPRREFLRVGGSALFGMSLTGLIELKARTPEGTAAHGKGFGGANSVILLFLQGGPSHIDIWDPKPDAPSNVRGEFKPIKTKVSGLWVSET